MSRCDDEPCREGKLVLLLVVYLNAKTTLRWRLMQSKQHGKRCQSLQVDIIAANIAPDVCADGFTPNTTARPTVDSAGSKAGLQSQCAPVSSLSRFL